LRGRVLSQGDLLTARLGPNLFNTDRGQTARSAARIPNALGGTESSPPRFARDGPESAHISDLERGKKGTPRANNVHAQALTFEQSGDDGRTATPEGTE